MILISITLMLKAKAKPVNKAHKGMIRTYEDESGELYTYSYRIFTGIVIAFSSVYWAVFSALAAALLWFRP